MTEHHYARSNGTIVRFVTETDRDHWVKMAPQVRETLPPRASCEEADRLEQLAEHGLAQWRAEEDPDADVSYEVPDLVIPAQVAGLPTAQARAYWLCSHEDGPRLSQTEAGWLMQTGQGNVSTHLKRARDKMGD